MRGGSSPARVRRLHSRVELAPVLALAQQAFAESRYAAYPFAAGRLSASIEGLLHAGERAALFLAERQGEGGAPEPAGALIATLAELRFADFATARVLFFYVPPSHRRSNVALELLSAFRAWARENGAADLSISVTMGGKDDDRVVAFLVRKGFEAAGDNMYKPLLSS